jgi:hypothetical protein
MLRRKRKVGHMSSGSSQEAGSSMTPSNPQTSLRFKILQEPEPSSPISNLVDIIFVQGLGGSARDTWTHPSSKCFWPDLLHENETFCNARISTFGYDSNFTNIFASNNVFDISDFAKQLLNCLDLHYDKYGDVICGCLSL